MNPFKRGDTVHFEKQTYKVKFVQDDELFIENHTGRKRVLYTEVSGDF